MKKGERFFNWLNCTVFHKNIMLEKTVKLNSVLLLTMCISTRLSKALSKVISTIR